jgi:hypothetical protein
LRRAAGCGRRRQRLLLQLESKFDVWERSYNEVQVSGNDSRWVDSFGAYVEANPVRAHIVSEPGAYPTPQQDETMRSTVDLRGSPMAEAVSFGWTIQRAEARCSIPNSQIKAAKIYHPFATASSINPTTRAIGSPITLK